MKDIKKIFLEGILGKHYSIKSVEDLGKEDDATAYKLEVKFSVEAKNRNPFASCFDFELDEDEDYLVLNDFTCADKFYQAIKEDLSDFGIKEFEIDYPDISAKDIDISDCWAKRYFYPQTFYSPKEEGFDVYGTVVIPLMLYIYD